MRRELPIHIEKEAFSASGKNAVPWGESFPVGMQLFGEKGNSHREQIHGGKGAS